MGSINSNCCGTGKGTKKARKRMRKQDQIITQMKSRQSSKHIASLSPLHPSAMRKSVSLCDDEKTINMDRVSVYQSLISENEEKIWQTVTQQYVDSDTDDDDDDKTIESNISQLSSEDTEAADDEEDAPLPTLHNNRSNLLTPTTESDWRARDPNEIFDIKDEMEEQLQSLHQHMNKDADPNASNLFRIKSVGKWEADDIESHIDSIKGQMVHMIKTQSRRNSSVSSAATNTSTYSPQTPINMTS